MSKISHSSCRICRRENTKLFLKGDRCYTDKCAYERRPYPPGQHGQSRLKFSEYALQLREKQKAKRYYGMFEKQFRNFFERAENTKGVTGENLLQLLEMRLDNVVYALGFASSRREARQLVSHRHFLVNGKPVNVPSYALKATDTIEVRQASREMAKVMAGIESSKKRETPDWLSVEHGIYKGTIKDKPARTQISLPVEENMIVEYYSR